MSRAYRIRVRESLRRHVRARDSVSTQLELLGILPAEQMAELLAEELERRGFAKQDGKLVRQDNGTVVTVEPATGTVSVQAETEKVVEQEGEKEGYGYDEPFWGRGRKKAEKQLREELQRDLQSQVDQQAAKLQTEVTDKLEAQLGDLRQELDQAVNRVTAEALKRRAAQIGQIKEMTEDPQSGSLTIVLEV